jgi:hypothetical protein
LTSVQPHFEPAYPAARRFAAILTAALVLGAGYGSTARAQTGLYTLSSGTDDETVVDETSALMDQSCIYVYGTGALTVGSIDVTKIGDASNTDDSDEFGINAAVLAGSITNAGTIGSDGMIGSGVPISITGSPGTIDITGFSSYIYTTGASANGLFATYPGSSITIDGGTISTTGTDAHGVDVTFGAAATVDYTDVETTGPNSAGVFIGYGGGSVTILSGSIKTEDVIPGSGSAGLYAAGTMTATEATVSSAADFGTVVDGLNTMTLTNSKISGQAGGIKVWTTPLSTLTVTSAGHPGATPPPEDAVVTMDGGSLTATAGPAFSVDGADTGNAVVAAITVEGDTTITAGTGNLISVTSASEGPPSAATFTLMGETVSGALTADSYSDLDAILESATELTGAASNAALSIDFSSTWNVNAASTLASLANAGTLAFTTDGLTVDVSGNYTESSTAKLVVVLGGTSGANYDQIAVAGRATLAGTLEVNVASGSLATIGDTFNIVTYGSSSGTFAGLTSDTGLAYEISYGPTAATITITGGSFTQQVPTITREPMSLSVSTGRNATFSVAATGTGTLSYHWYKDGAPIAGATNASYTVSDVTSSSAGTYHVAVTNAAGKAVSNTVRMEVTAARKKYPAVSLKVLGDSEIVAGLRRGRVLFTRTQDAADLTVYYALTGTAINGTDYTGTNGAALPGKLLLPAGTASATLEIVAAPGRGTSSLETVKVVLQTSPSDNYNLGSPAKAQFTLAGGQ